MSYRKTHVKSRINRSKTKESVLRKGWFWITVLCVLVIGLVGYFVLFYSGVQVKSVEILGNKKVSTEDIEDVVAINVKKEFFSFAGLSLPSSSIFLVNKEKIVHQLLDKYPTIEEVAIDKKLFSSLLLNILEREPVAVFCPTNINNGDNPCYFMDNTGVVFEPLAEAEDNKIIVRQDMDKTTISAGKKVIEHSTMDLLLKLEKSMRDNFGIKITEATITSPIKLSVTTEEKWKIYFNLGASSDANQELAKLELLLKGGISDQERENLRYIDLKPKDRAIVCDNSECDR